MLQAGLGPRLADALSSVRVLSLSGRGSYYAVNWQAIPGREEESFRRLGASGTLNRPLGAVLSTLSTQRENPPPLRNSLPQLARNAKNPGEQILGVLR